MSFQIKKSERIAEGLIYLGKMMSGDKVRAIFARLAKQRKHVICGVSQEICRAADKSAPDVLTSMQHSRFWDFRDSRLYFILKLKIQKYE